VSAVSRTSQAVYEASLLMSRPSYPVVYSFEIPRGPVVDPVSRISSLETGPVDFSREPGLIPSSPFYKVFRPGLPFVRLAPPPPLF